MRMPAQLKRDLRALRDPDKAAFFPKFFKCGKGEYGEGDRFIGLSVPQMRSVAKKHRDLPLSDIATLLADPIHEYRYTALLILVERFRKGTDAERDRIAKFYLDHLDGVNNWDLVDTSAPQILGAHLLEKKADILDRFARTDHLWTQRIAIVATQEFIRNGRLDDTIRIANILLHHPHDLMHKAVGWMLRELGKKDERMLRTFLDRHAGTMPRTMLRYAIEKFDEKNRRKYMAMKAKSA